MLADKLGALPGVEILHPVEANAVFARLPRKIKDGLKARGWKFYSFIGGGSRFMCSWQTGEEDVEALLSDARDYADGGTNSAASVDKKVFRPTLSARSEL